MKWQDHIWCERNCKSLDEENKKCRVFDQSLMKCVELGNAKFMKDSECLHLLDFENIDLFLFICNGGNIIFIPI